jgi:hypothetical protein
MVDAYRRQAAKDEASKMLSQALREILTGAKA